MLGVFQHFLETLKVPLIRELLIVLSVLESVKRLLLLVFLVLLVLFSLNGEALRSRLEESHLIPTPFSRSVGSFKEVLLIDFHLFSLFSRFHSVWTFV
mmetsp:Transcript_36357/g.35248  ORF Transcript_36357/g.35248 Transcript_36357/m.35248 type:complete len:98 (+) Transcript_36357:123-416(+)